MFHVKDDITHDKKYIYQLTFLIYFEGVSLDLLYRVAQSAFSNSRIN